MVIAYMIIFLHRKNYKFNVIIKIQTCYALKNICENKYI